MIRRRRRPDPAVEADAVAADLDRLGALFAAGATQPAAWAYLAAVDGSGREVAAAVARAAEEGRPLESVFRRAHGAWRASGAVVAVAAETGAPLADAMRTAAVGARRTAELHRAVATAMAGPVASARLVLLLPPATALLGWAFGFDVPGVLLSPIGLVILLAGSALLTAAALWSRRLIRAAGRADWAAGLDLELVATAVRAGIPVPRALLLARSAMEHVGIDPPPVTALEEVLRFSASAGLPVVALLTAEADRVRRSGIAAARIRAEELAVRLLLPLGLLVLPAFLVLGALPVGLAVLSSTALPL